MDNVCIRSSFCGTFLTDADLDVFCPIGKATNEFVFLVDVDICADRHEIK